MLMASSMASTMESGLEERDTTSSSSSSTLLVVAAVDDVGWRGTDSSSMSLKRDGLAAWMDIYKRCSYMSYHSSNSLHISHYLLPSKDL